MKSGPYASKSGLYASFWKILDKNFKIRTLRQLNPDLTPVEGIILMHVFNVKLEYNVVKLEVWNIKFELLCFKALQSMHYDTAMRTILFYDQFDPFCVTKIGFC